MTTFSGPYVRLDHPAVEALFAQIVAAYRTAQAKSAVEYLPGFRDGLARAYCTVTGADRQQVGDQARRQAAQSGAADMSEGSAAPEHESPKEQP